MPHGELYIKTHKTKAGRSGDGYVDAYDRYGLSLDNGAVSKFLTPSANKEATGNSNALTAGVAYIGSTVGVKDEMTLSLEAHIYAASVADFISKLDLFTEEVCNLDAGEFIRIKTSLHPNRVFRCTYQNFQQFTTFNTELAMFIWTLKEPHPELRDQAAPAARYGVAVVVENEAELDELFDSDYPLMDGDYAILLHPTSTTENSYLRVYEEDGADLGGPVWRRTALTASNGDYVRNFIDGSYWQFNGEAGTRGEWKKHWY